MTDKFEQRARDSYDKKAENYEETQDGRFTEKFKKQLLDLVEIPEAAVVLDVACGNGRLLQLFSQKAAIQGFGIDISPKMVETAKRMNPDKNFFVSACDSTMFEEKKFDLVTVCAAFHHFPRIDKFAKEMNRIMKPGGIIYIADVYLPLILRVICNPFLRFSRAGDVKFYAPEQIVKCFEREGFRCRTIQITENVQIVCLQRT